MFALLLKVKLKYKNMAAKGVQTTSDYVKFDEFQKLVESLIKDKKYIWAMYMSLSFSTGLRISDILSIRWKDILGKESLVKIEQKTDKVRNIRFSDSTINKFKELYKRLGSPSTEMVIVANKNGQAMSEQYINRVLKQIKTKYRVDVENFSTHSIRKTFARNIWEMNNRSEESLVLLMEILNHSSMAITRRYLGITGDEISNIYKSIIF